MAAENTKKKKVSSKKGEGARARVLEMRHTILFHWVI